MGDESEVQSDYDERLTKLADAGPLHKIDNEAGVVDTTDQVVEETEGPYPMAAFRIDPRGNCSGLARAPATSRPIHGHRRPGHRCVHVSVERTKEALLALPEAELTTTLAVHPQHRRHDHPQGAGGLPRRRSTSSRTIWVTIPVRREAPLQGVTAATNAPS